MIKWKLTLKAVAACIALLMAMLYVTPNVEGFTGGRKYGPFHPSIIDGDTISNGTERFRLVGVDTCEMGQPIKFPDQEKELDCGYYARAFVEQFIGNDQVICYDQGTRSYGRIVARCYAGSGWPTMRNDIGGFAIYSGWGVPTDHAGAMIKVRYILEYVSAKAKKRGTWAGSSVLPEVWRSAQKNQ